MHTMRIEFAAVMCNIVVSVLHSPFQSFELQRAQLVAAGALNLFEVSGGWVSDWHSDRPQPLPASASVSFSMGTVLRSFIR